MNEEECGTIEMIKKGQDGRLPAKKLSPSKTDSTSQTTQKSCEKY